MKSRVVTATPHQTAGHVRELLEKNKISIVPVTGPEKEILGVVSSTDLLKKLPDAKPVSQFMTKEVRTINVYEDVSVAAKLMRKNKIHHLIVIDKKKLAGVISTFDLLQLIDSKRFVIRNAPTPAKSSS